MMNRTPFSAAKAQAWHRLFHERTCPEVGVLMKADQNPWIKQHLKSCGECRRKLEIVGNLEAAGKLLSRIPVKCREPSWPKPGEVRRIRPASSPDLWFDRHDGRYFRPPLVVILGYPNEEGFVRAAQVFDEPDLCDFGDIDIGNGQYAEAWNTYSVHLSLLAPKCYRPPISVEKIHQILDMDLVDYPSISELDPVFHFRVLETRVGSFFTMDAVFSAYEW